MQVQDKAGHGNGSFIPGAVRIVDYDAGNNNLLVRGSSAMGTAGFSMAQLIEAIQDDPNYSLLPASITLAQNPNIVDFCLIGFAPRSKDQRIVDAEQTWFQSTPQNLNGSAGPYPVCIPSQNDANPGTMVFWPVQSIGYPVPWQSGDDWTSSTQPSIGAANDGFDFQGLVAAIQAALGNQYAAVPDICDSIVYVHCDSGVNRTGAAIASYLMCYGSNLSAFGLAARPAQPYSLEQAQTAANLAPPSNDTLPPGGCDIPVAEALCNYLQTQGYNSALAPACVPLFNPNPTS